MPAIKSRNFPFWLIAAVLLIEGVYGDDCTLIHSPAYIQYDRASRCLTDINGTAYFHLMDPTTNPASYELWQTNGTSAGTSKLRSFKAKDRTTTHRPEEFTNYRGALFFLAEDTRFGKEIWKYSRAGGGPTMLKDITREHRVDNIYNLTVFRNQLFFMALDKEAGYEPWRSDGTARGTVRLKDINSGPGHSLSFDFKEHKGWLFFSGSADGRGRGLWKTNGTALSTVQLKQIKADNADTSTVDLLLSLDKYLLTMADDGSHGSELWRSDGTPRGTIMVKDINPGGQGSSIASMTRFREYAFFASDDGKNGVELWKTDGTSQGTRIVRDINKGGSSHPYGITATGNTIFFVSDDGKHGAELWVSDGTSRGTRLTKDIRRGAKGSSPAYPTLFNNILYFTADDGTTGRRLWKSDGTSAGTVRVFDVPNLICDMDDMAISDGNILFWATAGKGKIQLWKCTPSVITKVRPNKGDTSGGTRITISGGNLGSGTDISEVLIGGIPARIETQSKSEIRVVSQASNKAGTVSIVVKSLSKGTTIKGQAYLYQHKRRGRRVRKVH
jgi:ELWxxDGT repeat protein